MHALSFRFALATLAFLSAARAAADPIFENGFEECPAITTRACYTGPAGTLGVGTCQSGTQHCENGAWSACTSDRTPLAESCNGEDDDCDAALDDGLGNLSCGIGACQQTPATCTAGVLGTCTPGSPTVETCDGIDNDCDGAIDEDGCNCVYVSPLGNDTNPGTTASPMKTINAAIAKAASNGPPIVCVATGITCLSAANYDEAVVMQNGVSVYGGYQQTGNPWPRSPSCVTRIRAQDLRGVYFDASVTAPTILDGFALTAANVPTNAAVTVQGSTGAIISDNVITGSAGLNSYGVNVVDDAGTAATPRLRGNVIAGGTGSTSATGVRSLNSAPRIEDQCGTLDASGRCTAAACSNVSVPSIRARAVGGAGGAVSYGIRLEASPGAVVERNAICTGSTSTSDADGIWLDGNADATIIRANTIAAVGGAQNSIGIRLGPCGGASPWIVGNAKIGAVPAAAATKSEGIRAEGDCHPRIDENLRIVGSDEGSMGDATGIKCDSAGGVASRCTISGNAQILGSGAGSPGTVAAIRCGDGACAAIRDNAQISGRGGQATFGVVLGATDTEVDANVIQAGCALGSGVGLLANDAYARIQNNRIEGVTTAGNCTATVSDAVRLQLGTGLNEVDLHSNDLVGQLGGGTCASRGLVLGLLGSPPVGPRGMIRNNIVSAGACNDNIAIVETNAGSDPRLLQNNDLWSPVVPTALYRDEGGTDLGTIAAVNALTGTTASANISADPLYDGSNKLLGTSPCREAGLLTGAPAFDFEDDARPQGPLCDIGRDEFVP